MNKYSKPTLIKLLRNFYQTNNFVPLANEKYVNLPCSNNFIRRFGSWTNALLAADIPLKKTPPSKSQEYSCKHCNKLFFKQPAHVKKSLNHFCSSSCAATYNNTHKTKGCRRSKLEVWLEEQLPLLYPNLEFHFNRKDVINSELDIYLPQLKLAFELNGIYHYEPIHGKEQLNKIQNNDNRKFQACLENNIELCIIDSSQLSYFKPKHAQKYLNIIAEVINKQLGWLK